ncbi:hypothetical protein PIB30_077400 [Stylosanthes scabra]|uniref:Uncharacterized protein n=1 Tax=Stylosanthes scabra TaxID=79078 RepID=A0ABU6QQL2_9FABA|nr:hypothetical protein [Stylosanthes scabra]
MFKVQWTNVLYLNNVLIFVYLDLHMLIGEEMLMIASQSVDTVSTREATLLFGRATSRPKISRSSTKAEYRAMTTLQEEIVSIHTTASSRAKDPSTFSSNHLL